MNHDDMHPTAAPDQAAAMLRSAAPAAGWRRLDLVVRMLADVEEYQLTVILDDGSAPPLTPPPGIAPLFRGMRRLAFTPDNGTWYTARLTLDSRWPAPGFRCVEDAEIEPAWSQPVPAAAYRADLATVFGELPQRVPAWLAGILEADRDQ